MEIDIDDELNSRNLLGLYPPLIDRKEHVSDQEDAETILKACNAYASNVPRLSSLKAEGFQPAPAILEDLKDYRQSLVEVFKENAVPDKNRFPNLGWEAIKAGLAQEQYLRSRIDGHVQEAEKMHKEIDLLLDLSAELTAHKDGDPMSEKTREILDKLKNEYEIDLWKGGDFNKEKASALKSLASSKVDQIRSNLQILFATKLQNLITFITTIMDCIKEATKSVQRQNSKALQLMTGR